MQADIERDQLVLPEQRWPYVSTRAKALPQPMPDFDKLHKSEHCPHYRDTVSAQLRRACVEEQAPYLPISPPGAVAAAAAQARLTASPHISPWSRSRR